MSDDETKKRMIDSLDEYSKTNVQTDDSRTKLSEDSSYRYFTNESTMDRFFYMVGKSILNNRLEYVAGIYHFNIAKQFYVRGNAVSYKKKTEAMDWAKKKFEESIK